jgi:predicted RNase H-like nuclease (RuvC/YqgF family)
MDETTDDNVVQIKPPDLDAGYRQQRYRRKNHHAKSRKTRTAKTSLSDAATTSDNADNVEKKTSSRNRKMTARPMTWGR